MNFERNRQKKLNTQRNATKQKCRERTNNYIFNENNNSSKEKEKRREMIAKYQWHIGKLGTWKNRSLFGVVGCLRIIDAFIWNMKLVVSSLVQKFGKIFFNHYKRQRKQIEMTIYYNNIFMLLISNWEKTIKN